MLGAVVVQSGGTAVMPHSCRHLQTLRSVLANLLSASTPAVPCWLRPAPSPVKTAPHYACGLLGDAAMQIHSFLIYVVPVLLLLG